MNTGSAVKESGAITAKVGDTEEGDAGSISLTAGNGAQRAGDIALASGSVRSDATGFGSSEGGVVTLMTGESVYE